VVLEPVVAGIYDIYVSLCICLACGERERLAGGGGGCLTVRRNSAPTNVSSHGIEDTVSRFFFRIGKGYDGLMARVEGWAPCGSCNGRERERERERCALRRGENGLFFVFSILLR